MNFKRLKWSVFFALFTTFLPGWPIVSLGIETIEERPTSLTQEEFENLKREKTDEIWNSVDYMTRFGYMQGIITGYFQYVINEAWSAFYAAHQDPSGKDWSLGDRQHYDLYGDIIST